MQCDLTQIPKSMVELYCSKIGRKGDVEGAHGKPYCGKNGYDLYGKLRRWGSEMKVLDPCCGSKMMWSDKSHPNAIFGDIRAETITVTDRSHGNARGKRILRIEPDILMDFRAIPFDDDIFSLVVFDPPHLVRAGNKSWLVAKYGKLSDDWRSDLSAGFQECFRVLAPDGTLVFKWNETQVKVSEVLALAPQKPLFGHLSGRKGLTHWLVFMK